MIQELLEKRNQNSKTFALGNGKCALDMSIGAVHYKDNQGKWQDIDEEYAEPDEAPFTEKFTKLPYHLRMNGYGERRIYPDRNDLSYWIEFGRFVPETGLPEKGKAKWHWRHGTYESEIGVQGGRVKFNIFLKTKPSPTSFTIPYILHNLTLQNYLLYHNGQVVGGIRKPFAIDAKRTKRDVDISFGSGEITLSLDTTGLVYPIEIDPTLDLQVAASNDDCHIRGGSVFELTYGYFAAGAESTGGYDKKGSAAHFSNVAMTRNITITTAYLRLICNLVLGEETAVLTRISAEDADSPGDFAEDDYDSFMVRFGNHTTARIDWDNIPVWVVDTEYQSPELKTVIQEIVDRANWASGNDIVIFWEDFDDRTGHVNTRIRYAYSYDGSTIKCEILHIEYAILSREATVKVGVKVTSAKLCSFIRSATVKVGAKITATKAKIFAQTTTVKIGVKVTATKVKTFYRTATVKIGIKITGFWTNLFNVKVKGWAKRAYEVLGFSRHKYTVTGRAKRKYDVTGEAK